MRTFKDNQNQEWRLQLTLGKARKIKQLLGIDVNHPGEHALLMQSLTERIAYVFVLCQDQATELEIDEDEFEARLMGDDICDGASDALLEELTDFFLRCGQKAKARLTAKHLASLKRGRETVDRLIETGQIDSALDQEAENLIRKLLGILGDGSPNSNPSQDTPNQDDSLSENSSEPPDENS